ncbi:sulfatase family protein [Paenibacillus sp.]|uniref:sulfatase family protein n=1 Tax=Paenibacillus sp. TaxID=58172 RepID=UPI002D271999|nr:sulfatase-like hydrolase/transferase [Paenibacillus sp.]HZG56782.1 sulfatase-like hydrolase/transferase [Paenibacillus sp.]
MSSRPNIILISTDQQRYDSIAANGSDFMHTPNLDRLASEGTTFRRAYCPNTVCTPSRVSMMTGLHLSRHGSYNIGTVASDPSLFLSSLLRENGYRTHHVGKAHWFPWESDSPETKDASRSRTPFADFAGFHTAELSRGHGPWAATSGHYAAWLESQGVDPHDIRVNFLFKGQGDYNGTGDSQLPERYHQGAWVAERAVHWMKEQAGDAPFFLNLGFQDPHHPHILPFDFPDRVDPESIPMPDLDTASETGTPEHVPHFRAGTLVESRFNGKFEMAGNGKYAWGPYFAKDDFRKQTRAYYYSMVQLIDRQVGRILDALDELGLANETFVVFTSDHGEMLGDHGIGQKGPLVYEGVTKVPLLARYPAGFGPRPPVEACASLVDLVPTFLDAAGIVDPVRREGISLMPALRGEAEPERRGVRIEYKEEPDRIRFKCWVTPEWKLAVYTGEPFGELYDLKNDPGEKRNLFAAPEFASIRQELLLELLADLERGEPVNPRPSRV